MLLLDVVLCRHGRSSVMGLNTSSSSAAEAETCRIVVEDVTSSSVTSQEVASPEVFSPVIEERRLSTTSSDTTVYAGSRRGSALSIDTRRSSGGAPAEFWVPPSVIQRTRSRSLAPPDHRQFCSDDSDGDMKGAIRSLSVTIIMMMTIARRVYSREGQLRSPITNEFSRWIPGGTLGAKLQTCCENNA